MEILNEIDFTYYITVFLQVVIIPAVPYIIYKICQLIKIAFDYIASKIENAKAKEYLSKIQEILYKCVECTTNTFVDKLKATNNFTVEKQKEAFVLSKDAFLKTINAEMKEFLREVYGDYNEWIKITIEKMVEDIKEEQKIKEKELEQ